MVSLGVGTFFSLFLCFIFIVVLLGSIFWIWMIIDCASNEPSGSNEKLVWLLIIILGHLLGAIIYYFARRPERLRVVGR